MTDPTDCKAMHREHRMEKLEGASEGAPSDPTGPAKVVAAVPTGSPAAAPLPQPDRDASDYDDEVDYEAEGEEEYYDCGMICDRRGNPIGCQDAGSEQCDFECPNRDYLYACLARRSGKQGNTPVRDAAQPRSL